MHGRSKYIDIHFHFLSNLSKECEVELMYCASQDQLADIMTKSLKLELFEKLKKLFGICRNSKIASSNFPSLT